MNDLELSLEDSPGRSLPPLRVYHFFLWSIAVAAVMASFAALGTTEPVGMTIGDANVTFGLVAATIAATTLLLGLYWRWRGMTFFGEPGHWLLVTTSLGLLEHFWLLVVRHNWVLFGLGDGDSWKMFALLAAPGLLVTVAAAVIYFCAARMPKYRQGWRRFFWVATISNVLEILLGGAWLAYRSWLSVASPTPAAYLLYVPLVSLLLLYVAPAIACFLAVLQDIRNVDRRHWSHWVGAVVWLSLAVLQIGFLVYSSAQQLR